MLTKAGKQDINFFSVLKIIKGQVSQNYLAADVPFADLAHKEGNKLKSM